MGARVYMSGCKPWGEKRNKRLLVLTCYTLLIHNNTNGRPMPLLWQLIFCIGCIPKASLTPSPPWRVVNELLVYQPV